MTRRYHDYVSPVERRFLVDFAPRQMRGLIVDAHVFGKAYGLAGSSRGLRGFSGGNCENGLAARGLPGSISTVAARVALGGAW